MTQNHQQQPDRQHPVGWTAEDRWNQRWWEGWNAAQGRQAIKPASCTSLLVVGLIVQAVGALMLAFEIVKYTPDDDVLLAGIVFSGIGALLLILGVARAAQALDYLVKSSR